MNRARFIAAARLEFLAEVIYYSEAQAELGTRFTAAVEEAAARALAFPLSGSPFRANTRRVFVQEFPFALIYRPEPDGIVIFAVAHHAKRPTTGNLGYAPANRRWTPTASRRVNAGRRTENGT